MDTGRKLNAHKTFRRRPGRLLNVLCTFNIRPVSKGLCKGVEEWDEANMFVWVQCVFVYEGQKMSRRELLANLKLCLKVEIGFFSNNKK